MLLLRPVRELEPRHGHGKSSTSVPVVVGNGEHGRTFEEFAHAVYALAFRTGKVNDHFVVMRLTVPLSHRPTYGHAERTYDVNHHSFSCAAEADEYSGPRSRGLTPWRKRGPVPSGQARKTVRNCRVELLALSLLGNAFPVRNIQSL